MKISLIAVIGPHRELGKDNKLLYHIPADLKRFKKITEAHPVIMGRKTFESIGGPLQHRLNIVITRNRRYKTDQYNNLSHSKTVVVNSLGEALIVAKKEKWPVGVSNFLKIDSSEIFIIGGGQIYQQAIKIADKLYLTIVDSPADADTFFPDYSEFKKVIFDQSHQSGGYKFRFVELVR
ncbi:MAG: dihydrofolate reductase [Microgenomates group bacterium]|nr:dihydrofolate reductase [Microgenomates group bacterium]